MLCCAKSFQLCLTLCVPWTVALQAPLSMGFSRQEYWCELLVLFLQGIVPVQGSDLRLCLLHHRQVLYRQQCLLKGAPSQSVRRPSSFRPRSCPGARMRFSGRQWHRLRAVPPASLGARGRVVPTWSSGPCTGTTKGSVA